MRRLDDSNIFPGSSFLGSIDRVRNCNSLYSPRPSHPRSERFICQHETARLYGLNGMEWGRGTGPVPSGEGKEEKHTRARRLALLSLGSIIWIREKECFRLAKTLQGYGYM